MKSTGMVRRVDELGRVTIPKEIRKQLGITDNVDSFEIFTEGNTLILRKYAPSCAFCNKMDGEIVNFKGVNVCKSCIDELTAK